MQLSETAINVIFLVAIVLLLAFSFYIRIRRMKRSALGRVATILGDLNKNQKLVDDFSYHHAVKGFRTRAWKKNKDTIEFIPENVRIKLAKVFEMSDEVNDRIKSAKRVKSDSYMAGIDLSRLKTPLAEARQQLREWVQENMQNPEYLPKRRRGLFR
ncbi:MAG: hypothetical protein A2144_08885 [Chloroflexi bacterium RBG_16_50_9]|nr:MAG: hypothetical protein A2144_08885 [Chloroflexi bacterium RBG_16_50_9]